MSVKRVGKYEIGRTLGEGTFGKVKHGVNVETNEHVAIKVLDKDKIQKQNMGNQIKREISIMKMVCHRYVVGMKEVLASKSKIFIVLELVTGGELFDRIVKEGRFPEEKARYYAQQLVEGVDYCHSMGICHRDLSKFRCLDKNSIYLTLTYFLSEPENLLLDEYGNLKISDFGLSSLYVGDADGDGASRTEQLFTTCGTPNYVAPEVLADKGYDGKKADVWSIGVIIYVLLAGFLPFDERTIVELFSKIQKAEFTYPSWFSEEARAVLNSILVSQPAERVSLAAAKAHSWMRWSEVEGVMTARRAASLQSAPTMDRTLEAQSTAEDRDDPVDEEDDDENKGKGIMDSPAKTRTKSSAKLIGARRLSMSSGNKVLNAFDLVSQCGGFALNKIFKVEPPSVDASMSLDTGRRAVIAGNSSGIFRYTSDSDSEKLLQDFAALLVDCGFTMTAGDDGLLGESSPVHADPSKSSACILDKTKLKATIITPKGVIGLNAYVFVLTGSLSLLEIRRGKGDILEFYSIYTSVVARKLSLTKIVRMAGS